MMKRRDWILAVICHCAVRPEFSRMSLQKVTYLAGNSVGRELNHRPYFYGPFSDVVEGEVNALVMSGFIDEKARQSRPFLESERPSVGEYSITARGQGRLAKLREAYAEEFQQLEQFIDRLLQATGTLDESLLAPLTNVMIIRNEEGRDLSHLEITELASKLGWELPEEGVNGVGEMITSLGDHITEHSNN